MVIIGRELSVSGASVFCVHEVSRSAQQMEIIAQTKNVDSASGFLRSVFLLDKPKITKNLFQSGAFAILPVPHLCWYTY